MLKIDVEGAEALVMQGAVGVLQKFRPIVLCEVGTDTRPLVVACLTDLGYRLATPEDASGRGGISDDANIIAIP